MAEGGGACTDEVLDSVRELLRGQRRLEKLVAGLARSRGAATASGDDGVALALAAKAGAEQKPCRGEESAGSRQVSKEASRQLSKMLTGGLRSEPSLTGSFCGHGGLGGEPMFDRVDSPIETHETRFWLERTEIREQLAECGNNEDLAAECQRLSAIFRSRTNRLGIGTQAMLRRQASLGLGHASRRAWLSRLSQYTMLCPASSARAWFDFISICVLSYNLSSIPYFIAFEVDQGGSPWFGFECMSVAFWSLDILLSFRTGYYVDGHLYMDPGKAARRYLLKGGLFLDMLTLTVDIIAIILQTSWADSASFFRTVKIVRIMRLSAVMRMRNLNGILERLGHTSHTVGSVKLFAGPLFNVCKFLLVLLWINHVIACLWCFLGQEYDSQDSSGPASDTGHTWMNLHSFGTAGTYGNSGQVYQYATAFHWSLTQMTPGSMQVFPVNSIERIFNIFVLMGGFLVFSVVVSAISTNAAQLRIDLKGKTQKMYELTRFLLASQIQPGLRMQVCKQVKVKLMQVRPQAVNDLAVLDMISLSLRHALQLALCNPHFLEHPLLHFLSNHDAAMWEETCMTCAHFSVLLKGDNLFVFGKEAQGMYFVVRGALSYDLDDSLIDSQELSKEAEPGAWLSEAALWCRWRHMGCAEAQGAASCEVLLLQADAVMPILTRKGLARQMAWAYAHSFHYFLQISRPPLCNWPSDLVLPFGSDEVIAAMAKDAAVALGKGAIEVLMAGSRTFSWAGSLREDKIEKLASEIRDGGSTLLVTSKQGVVRCVPLVVLRLRRRDGRVFVRMRLASKVDGSHDATCKLPGSKQRAGEYPDMCLQRLLEGKLSALADSIEVLGVERQRESETSRTFGVPTRYVRTVVSAAWPEDAATVLGQFTVLGVQPTRSAAARVSGTKLPNSLLSKEVKDSEFTVTLDRTAGQNLGMKWKPVRKGGGGFLRFSAETGGGLVQHWNHDHPTLAVKPGDHIVEVNGIRNDVNQLRSEVNQHQILVLRVKRDKARVGPSGRPSMPEEVFMFPEDTDFYTWLTEEELVFFNTSQGQPLLSSWLSELYKTVESPSDFEASMQLGRVPGA